MPHLAFPLGRAVACLQYHHGGRRQVVGKGRYVCKKEQEKVSGNMWVAGIQGAVSGDGDTAQRVACLPSVHQVLCLIPSTQFKLACNSSTCQVEAGGLEVQGQF